MLELEVISVSGEERFITPVDHTGLPYCFAPNTSLPPAGSSPAEVDGSHNYGREADFNHQFPKYEVALSPSPALDDIGRAALVGARVQWVDYYQHHEVYNPKFVGPEHPPARPELFQALAMATSGYVPEFAIDLSDDPKIVGLTTKQRKWLWTSGQVRVYCQSDVSKFLLGYIAGADIDHVDQLAVEEFIYTCDYDKKLELGRILTDQVIERVTEPLEPIYREARKKNLLTFVRVGNIKRAPPESAKELVRQKLTVGHKQGIVHHLFHRRFAARRPRRSRSEFEKAVAA